MGKRDFGLWKGDGLKRVDCGDGWEKGKDVVDVGYLKRVEMREFGEWVNDCGISGD